MFPYLVAAIIVIGLPTIYVACDAASIASSSPARSSSAAGCNSTSTWQRCRSHWCGPMPSQSPELSAVRGTIHFVFFLVCLYFGWFFRAEHPAD